MGKIERDSLLEILKLESQISIKLNFEWVQKSRIFSHQIVWLNMGS